MAYDSFGLLEAEAEDERHWRRFTLNPVFWFGIIEPPVYVRAGQVIRGYPAHWIVRLWNQEHATFVEARDYTLPVVVEEQA